MAITFRHDAASLAGAFGGESGQRRSRKYATDMLAQQQARRPKPLLLEQPEGQWHNPVSEGDAFFTALDETGQRELRRMQKAQLRTAQRKYRLGRQYEGSLLPQFQPQAEIDALRKRDEAVAAGQQKEADAAWDFHLKGIDRQIPAIPEHLVGTEWESDLKKINEAERRARGDRSLSEDQREEAITKIQEQRDSVLKGAPAATTPMEEWNSGLRYMGPDGKVHSERGEGEGWTPGHMRNGEFVETPQSVAQREQKKADAAEKAKADKEAAAAQAKADAERQKAKDELQRQVYTLDDEIAELEDAEDNDGKVNTKAIAAKDARRKALQDQLAAMNTPSGGAAPAAPPVVDFAPDGSQSPARPPQQPRQSASIVPLTPGPDGGLAPAAPISQQPSAWPTELTPEQEEDLFGNRPQELPPEEVTQPPPAPEMAANRNAPVNAPAPPVRARGSQQFGQPIRNYKPAIDTERERLARRILGSPVADFLASKGYGAASAIDDPFDATTAILEDPEMSDFPLLKNDWEQRRQQLADMVANRQAPVNAPIPPAPQQSTIMEGGQRYGQPIQNYQPKNDAERNLMAQGYARVPLLNAKGQKTGRYSWAPLGAQSPDMVANRQATANAPKPPATAEGSPRQRMPLMPEPKNQTPVLVSPDGKMKAYPAPGEDPSNPKMVMLYGADGTPYGDRHISEFANYPSNAQWKRPNQPASQQAELAGQLTPQQSEVIQRARTAAAKGDQQAIEFLRKKGLM